MGYVIIYIMAMGTRVNRVSGTRSINGAGIWTNGAGWTAIGRNGTVISGIKFRVHRFRSTRSVERMAIGARTWGTRVNRVSTIIRVARHVQRTAGAHPGAGRVMTWTIGAEWTRIDRSCQVTS